jgi:hypothetical protein
MWMEKGGDTKPLREDYYSILYCTSKSRTDKHMREPIGCSWRLASRGCGEPKYNYGSNILGAGMILFYLCLPYLTSLVMNLSQWLTMGR